MITLDGVRSPDFMKINSVQFSILPPLINNTLKVRGKYGAFLFGQETDLRAFTVAYTIKADEAGGVMKIAREMAEWLYKDKPVKLAFDDEPDKYYLVVPDGESNVTEIVNIGQGEIRFICIEPFAYSEIPKSVTIDNSLATITETEIEYAGTADAHPEIKVTVNEPISSLTVGIGEDVLVIGEPAAVEETPKNLKPRVLWDDMSNTLEGWTKSLQVDGGVVTGSFKTNGTSFRPESYGTGSNWHGPAMEKALDRPIDDFQIHFGMGFKTKDKKEVGRIELYLLDENGVQFGKIALVDKFATTNKNVLEARAGTWSQGTYFAKTQSIPDWDNMYGRIRLTRKGRAWTVNIAQEKPNGTYDYQYEKTWFDAANRWTHKLAKVQIHIGTYGNNKTPRDSFIPLIVVQELIDPKENEAPIIAIPDDVLLIDNEKMVVYLNGEPRFDLINPVSNFLKLRKGVNPVAVSPVKAVYEITYPERWL